MPPKAIKESLILLINIGVTSPNAKDNSYLEKAKLIATRKMEKMIFLTPKNEVAIMLMGSSDTKNSLNSEHIEEFTDFQVSNWDFIEEIMNLQNTRYCSNWIEALEAARKFMKQNVIGTSTKKIILMSNFDEEENIISQFQADTIANSLLAEKIELIAISEESLNEKPTSCLKISEKLLKDVLEKINGQHMTFDDAISSLKFYVEATKKPTPCYYTLELVDKKIPIVSYVKISEVKFPSWQRANKEGQKLQQKTVYLDRQRCSYTKDETIMGYKYGGSFISIEKKLKEEKSYKSGEKSYKIYNFTNKNNIDLDYFYKQSSHVILPSSSVNNVTKPFYSLVQAMHATNSVAIARKVFRKDSAPRMVALFPCIDVPDEPWCLIEIELAFAEDRRIMETRPMKSVMKQLSSEQSEAVDNLIDSMMLQDTDSYEVDGSQHFLPGCVPNPAVQHRWHMLSYRAINPNKPLPPMDDYLKELLEAPSIKAKSKFPAQKVAQLFRLETIDPKKKKEAQEDNMQVDDGLSNKEPDKTEDNKLDIESYSCKEESVLSLDTSDIDLDDLVNRQT
ncbi:X-ray repair cross-complementing protein 5 [Xylocopa sonorina]|uniref:X-ray repair cross-complementing protein 5 n=1 Tax=Xylocopa sonorina TaxID=1818115 RepID=UPI00403AC201